MIKRPFILKEEFKGAVLDGQPELTLSSATGDVEGISHKRIIRVACRKLRHVEIKLDSFQRVEEAFGILDGVQLEEFSPNRTDRCGRGNQWKRSRSWRRAGARARSRGRRRTEAGSSQRRDRQCWTRCSRRTINTGRRHRHQGWDSRDRL